MIVITITIMLKGVIITINYDYNRNQTHV